MKKFNFLTILFLFCLGISSCDKKVSVDPSLTSAPPLNNNGETSNKWNLKNINYKINSFDEKVEETVPYTTGYLQLLDNNKFISNLIAGSLDETILVESNSAYESNYIIKGNKITLDIKDNQNNAFIPYVYIIEENSAKDLKLKATKEEILITAAAIDKIITGQQNQDFLNLFVESIEIKLNFTR